jgi:hypothetical protein
MVDDRRENPDPAQPKPRARKAYKTPRLEEYGHVAKLTQSGGSTKFEPANPMGRACL